MHLTEFDDKPLTSVMKGKLDLGDVAADDETPEEEADGDHGPVLERFREALSERVKDVRVTRPPVDPRPPAW